MWDFISHSARAKRNRAIEQKKKDEAQKRISSFHMKRVPAQIRISGGLGGAPQVIQARIISTDLAEKRLRVFLPVALTEGTEVSITFADPTQFYIKGKVRWAHEHNLHRTVMSAVNYPYRTEIVFVMETEAERLRVREFALSFARRYIANEEVPATGATSARSTAATPPTMRKPLNASNASDLDDMSAEILEFARSLEKSA